MNSKKWIYSLVLLLFFTGYTHAIPNRSIKNALTGLKTVELAEEKPNSETLEKLKELTDVVEPQKLEKLLKNTKESEFDIIINRLHKDISISGFSKALKENGGLVDSWGKLFKEGDAVSDILRKDTKVLDWVSKQVNNIPQSAVDDLLTQIDKPIKETLEDAQGRLTFVLDRSGQSNKVVSVHTTSSGQVKTTTYSPSYNPDLNPDIPVPLSQNKLVPDYMGTQYMHPLQGDEVVKIKLSGNRNTDFSLARAELGISKADETVDGVSYTWHHMDDFEIINGEAYGTMQLVKSSAHQGTGVTGMQHSGSVSQWKAYFGSGY